MLPKYYQEMDLYRIALGCIYILADRAEVDFPGTTRAAPSEWVVVSRNVKPPLHSGDNHFFPFKVPWDLWQNVVVPILRGESQEFLMKFLRDEFGLTNPDWDTILRGMVLYLRLRIDPSLRGTVNNLSELDSLMGEPIWRGSLSFKELGYPAVDPQLAWIEGHKRLDYPEVD